MTWEGAAQPAKKPVKRKAIEDRKLHFKVYGDKNLKPGQAKPVVIYMHGILHGIFSPTEITNKKVDAIKIPEVSSFIGRMEELPFILIVPVCHDYLWALDFKELKKLVTKVLDNKHTEDQCYVIGNRLGGSAALHFGSFIPGLVRGVVSVDAGNLREANTKAIAKLSSCHLHLYTSADAEPDVLEGAKNFVTKSRDYGNIMTFHYPLELSEADILNEIIQKKNFMI